MGKTHLVARGSRDFILRTKREYQKDPTLKNIKFKIMKGKYGYWQLRVPMEDKNKFF